MTVLSRQLGTSCTGTLPEICSAKNQTKTNQNDLRLFAGEKQERWVEETARENISCGKPFWGKTVRLLFADLVASTIGFCCPFASKLQLSASRVVTMYEMLFCSSSTNRSYVALRSIDLFLHCRFEDGKIT